MLKILILGDYYELYNDIKLMKKTIKNIEVSYTDDKKRFIENILNKSYDLIIFNLFYHTEDPFDIIYTINQYQGSYKTKILLVEEEQINTKLLVEYINIGIHGLYYNNAIDIRKLLERIEYESYD